MFDFLGFFNLGCVYDMNYYDLLVGTTGLPLCLVGLLLLLNIHLMRIEILNRQLLLLLTRMHLLLLSSNVHSTVVNSSADDWSSHGHWRAIPRESVR